ncbi:MAG: SMI1/KNR4 family protein, partial [Rivularia sp. (in: cyanobacteria)]
MSNLTEALQRISVWMEKYQTEKDGKKIPFLAPGLTFEEIENKLKNLPFKLSEELYELYQWHNGGYSYLATEEEKKVIYDNLPRQSGYRFRISALFPPLENG